MTRTAIALMVIIFVSRMFAWSMPPLQQADKTDYMNESQVQRDMRMEWWRNARFGMFIHWGLYAVPGGMWKGQKIQGIGEWIMASANIPVAEYAPLAKQFNPAKFDAARWVSIAKNAGIAFCPRVRLAQGRPAPDSGAEAKYLQGVPADSRRQPDSAGKAIGFGDCCVAAG